ncbi:unnamed protein product, partial [Ectocarpus sp. 12 AP-2014]
CLSPNQSISLILSCQIIHVGNIWVSASLLPFDCSRFVPSTFPPPFLLCFVFCRACMCCPSLLSGVLYVPYLSSYPPHSSPRFYATYPHAHGSLFDSFLASL